MKVLIRHPKDKKEAKAALKLLKISFPKLRMKYFSNRILGDPEYRISNSFLLIKDGCVACFTQLFDKSLWWQGKRIRFSGLGFIATLPEYRNKGYASLLIKKIMSKREKCLMGLFTKIPEYYRKFDFSVIPRKRLVIKRKFWAQRSVVEGVKVRRFDYKRDIFQLMKIHRGFFSKTCGVVDRKLADWKSQLIYFNEEKKYFLVLQSGLNVAAYIRCKWHKDELKKRLEIVEYASNGAGHGHLKDFITYLFARTDANVISFQEAFLGSLPFGISGVEEELDCSMMWRSSSRYKYAVSIKEKVCFLEADGF